jgi:hypothetical protein
VSQVRGNGRRAYRDELDVARVAGREMADVNFIFGRDGPNPDYDDRRDQKEQQPQYVFHSVFS